MGSEDLSGRGTEYGCVFYLGGERVRALNREEAVAYVGELTWLIAAAKHDAAVVRQLQAADMPMRLVAATLRGLRSDRRPSMLAVTAPIEFAPIVSHRTGEGMLNGSVGEIRFEWDLPTARQHAQEVLEAAMGGDLDAAYVRYLRGVVGLELEEAQKYVTGLQHHMSWSTPGHTH